MGLPGYIQTTTFMKKCKGPLGFYTLVIGGSVVIGGLIATGIIFASLACKKSKEKKSAIIAFNEEWKSDYTILNAKGDKNTSFSIAFNDDEIKLLKKTKKERKHLLKLNAIRK